MPLLRILTNAPLDDLDPLATIRNLSKSISSALGKPESYVMVALETTDTMLFAGNNEPTAYIELKSLDLPEDKTADLSQQLCADISRELMIDTGRIYIEFTNGERHMWGWNGGTF